MGGTTAIGILADDGRVYYYLAGDYVGLMEILNTPYYEHVEKSYITCTLEEFLSAEKFEEDDSCGRYLVYKEGTMMFRLGGDSSTYKISKV
jgi:hypothetical protein